MKKLIVLSVVFALVATAAFAEASIGGNLNFATDLMAGDTADGSILQAGPLMIANSLINVNAGDAQAGGMLRIWSNGAANGGSGNNDWQNDFFTYLFWKPADWFRLQLGCNGDGEWGHAQITGWGFNGEAQQKVAIDGDNGLVGTAARVARTTVAWAPGYNGLGATVVLTPVDGLAINLAFPFGNGNGQYPSSKEFGAVYSRIYANVTYALQDIGTIRVSSQLGPGYNEGDADKWYGTAGTNDTTKLWASFYLMAIDGMGIDIGLGWQLPLDDSSTKRNYPLGIGVGFNFFGGGDFGFKARVGMNTGGSTEAGSVTLKDDTQFGIHILPSYNLGIMRVYLNAGFGMTLPDEGDSTSDWYVNPYIRKDIGGVRLYAGLKLLSDGTKDGDNDVVKWAVPIALQYYF